jgi:hypothetical protein
MQIRITRPQDKLNQVVAFYRDALGLAIIGHFEDHAGYSDVMLGVPGAQFHLESTLADAGSPCPAPSKDNLLVFYLPNAERLSKVVVISVFTIESTNLIEIVGHRSDGIQWQRSRSVDKLE